VFDRRAVTCHHSGRLWTLSETSPRSLGSGGDPQRYPVTL